MASAPPSPVIVGKKTLAESRFLRLVDISYKDTPDAAPRSWQSCERTTTQPGGVDGAPRLRNDPIHDLCPVADTARTQLTPTIAH